MHFGPDEKMSPHVNTDIRAEVAGKVVTADIIRAGKCSAVQDPVKPEVLATDASHKVDAGLLGEGAPVDCVEVIKDRPVGLHDAKIALRAAVDRLVRAPRNVAAKSNVVLKNHHCTKAWI